MSSDILPTLLHLTSFSSPLSRNLVPTIGVAFLLQTIIGAPSVYLQTEKIYDFGGAVTFFSCSVFSFLLPVVRTLVAGEGNGKARFGWGGLDAEGLLPWVDLETPGGGLRDWRQAALTGAVVVWSLRLGTYLLRRVLRDNGDPRFFEIRVNAPGYTILFASQAIWVTLGTLPIVAVNSLPRAVFSSLPQILPTDILGFSLFVFGIVFESIADWQKVWWIHGRKNKKHSEVFCARGLWSRSRHPNYFGEILLWSGLAVVAGGVLVSGPGQVGLGYGGGVLGKAGVVALCALSPAFTGFLLLTVSGVPLCDPKYDRQFGERKDYQEWKKNTPTVIPKLFK